MGRTGQLPSSTCAETVLGQDAREIVRDAAAGDVGHARGVVAGGELLDEAEVAAVGLHQGSAGFFLERVDVLLGLVLRDFEEELAGERVAVGVQAGGGEADEDVAGMDFGAGDQLGALDDADDEAGEVVFAVGVEAGHLRGLAADEGAAVGAAGVGEAGDDFLGDFAVEASGGEVVEEEERRGALHGDVVDAVVDQVGADGVVDAELEGDLELGADAVGGGDEDGLFDICRRGGRGRRSRRFRRGRCG